MWKNFVSYFTGNRSDDRPSDSLKRGWNSVQQQQVDRVSRYQDPADVQVLYVTGPSSKKSRLDPSCPSPKELEAWVTGSSGRGSGGERLYFQPRTAAGGCLQSRFKRSNRPNRHAHCGSTPSSSSSGIGSEEFSFRAEMPRVNGDAGYVETIDLTAPGRLDLEGWRTDVTEDEDDPPEPMLNFSAPSTSRLEPRPSIHKFGTSQPLWTHSYSNPDTRNSIEKRDSPEIQFVGESKSSQCSPNSYGSIVSSEKLRGRSRPSMSKVSPVASPPGTTPIFQPTPSAANAPTPSKNGLHRKTDAFSASKYIDLESRERLSRIIPTWDDEGVPIGPILTKTKFPSEEQKIDDNYMNRVKQLISSLSDGQDVGPIDQNADLLSELEASPMQKSKSPPPVITLDSTEAEQQFVEFGKKFEDFDPKSIIARVNADKDQKEQLLRKEERIRMEAEVLKEQREIKERRRSLKEETRLNLKLRGLAIVEEIELEEEEGEDEFPELDEEAEAVIENALYGGSPDQLLVEDFRIPIHRKDIRTLEDRQWLNDEVINFYLNLVMARCADGNHPKVYAFNTFFVPKLKQGGHNSLKRWTKKIDIFSYDYLLIPVHLEVHWCMAVIDMKKKIIEYYDSMGNANNWLLKSLEEYLQAEHLDKKKTKLDTSDWEKYNLDDIPQQKNGYDCGMFACKFAEYASRGAPINFSQQDIPYFRRRMIYEIVTKKLM